jgi:nitroreductase
MHTSSAATQDAHTVSDGLANAAAAAGYAPSIHNTQPWRWRVGSDTLDLYLHRSRVLAVIDPDTRLATLSCGAALHHARTALAAEGWRVTVARMPDAADQDHLANLRVYAPAPADPQAVRHIRTIQLRHTNRRPVVGPPVGPEDLRVITAAVKAEAAWLHMLRPEEVIELAAAADHAQRTEAGVPEWLTELAYWTGGTRPAETGIPSAATPQHAPQTTVPGRDVGNRGDLPISAEHDRAARFAILYGQSDEPRDWLRAGEALSAGWLTATERGISVLPLSAPVEVHSTRDTMRRLLSYLNHPFLVLRFGTVDRADADASDAPRLPTDQTIERL